MAEVIVSIDDDTYVQVRRHSHHGRHGAGSRIAFLLPFFLSFSLFFPPSSAALSLNRMQAPITPDNALIPPRLPPRLFSHACPKSYTLVSYATATLPRRLLLKGFGHVGPCRRVRGRVLDDVVPASALPRREVVLAGEAGGVDLCAGARVVDADFFDGRVDKGRELCVSGLGGFFIVRGQCG